MNASERYDEIIQEATAGRKYDWRVIKAIVATESSFNPNVLANEPNGMKSYGLAQILSWTAKRYGIVDLDELFDPMTNITLCVRIFDDFYRMNKGILEDSIASYNAGRKRWVDLDNDGVKDPDEPYCNQKYVDKVMVNLNRFTEKQGA